MPVEAFASNRRQHGRLRCEDLLCPLGTVQDFSASGMRVLRTGRGRGKPGDEFLLELISAGGDRVQVKVKVIRVEKIRFRRYALGLQFIDMDDQTHAQLIELVRNTADTRLFA